ncbi:peptidoglycan recognition protein family protein [Caloranaerobacter sp. DY30410]|uniref:peptidoglycan recognition protein family protein n=1 Tax=Caloranaerobacter sp. DY30410 TaxID=3238305 RepID=UPI003D01B416
MLEYRIIENYITPNKHSRPQKPLKNIKGIVIHWVANPKSSAKSNRDYFENRKYGKTGYGSAHEIIDLNGDIILCIPDNEIAYHVGSKIYTKEALERLSSYPNNCTYGIECCHLDWEGNMTKETYNSLVERLADLCLKYNLDPLKNIWLHKEVVGWKDCHRYFVRNSLAYEKLKEEVKMKLEQKKGDKKVLKDWQEKLGKESLDKLHAKGIINNPEQWKQTLAENVPQWLFWTIISRIIDKE